MADIHFPPEFVAANVESATVASATVAATTPGSAVNGPEEKPSRDELLKRLRAKCSRSAKKTNPKTNELAKQIGSYVNLPPSEIANLIAQSGTKKIAKNPLKFARKVAELIPGAVMNAEKKPGADPL